MLRSAPLILALSLVVACQKDPAGGNTNNTSNNNNQPPTPVCGDGRIDVGEQCDNGTANDDSAPDGCRTNCRAAYCGDGVVDIGETCDDGAANSDLLANACRRTCVLPTCGDGAVDTGEGCDDGGTEDGDGCDATCEVEPFWDCDGSPSACVCEPYRSGAGCATCVVHVDLDPTIAQRDGLTWASAYETVQEGIDTAAGTGGACEVWVKAGNYPIGGEDSALASVELASKVSVFGGFAGTETDRAERDWMNNVTVLEAERVFHVVRAEGTLDATLDGFTITGGGAVGDFQDGDGGGLYLYGSIVHVNNCIITGNYALRRGAGAFVYASALILTDSFVGLNATADPGSGGGIYAQTGVVGLHRVVVAGNQASDAGAGVFLSDAELIAVEVRIEQNGTGALPSRGGGLYIQDGGSAALDRCAVNGNQARLGAGVYTDDASNLAAVRSHFWGNLSTESGAGFYLIDTSATLTNVTVWQNSAAQSGGGFYLTGTSALDLVHATVIANQASGSGRAGLVQLPAVVTLVNSIVWSTNAAGLGFLGTGAITYHHSNIEGWPGGGVGNIDQLPRFVDAPNADFHLRSDSPCIDAADDAAAPPTDIEGMSRVDGGPGSSLADMGAYEYQPPPP